MKRPIAHLTQSKNGRPIIRCPKCARRMEVGEDKVAGDCYAQCRNQNCNFDGWMADSYPKLVALSVDLKRVSFSKTNF